nr:RES family NAD+ phosphorylase [Methylomonas paludis]
MGGRFNRPGCAALYLSLDPTTAWMEAQQGFPFKPQPLTLVAKPCSMISGINVGNKIKLAFIAMKSIRICNASGQH